MQLIICIVAIIVIIVAARFGRKAMEKPVGITLESGEKRIGEMYVSTRDIALGGFHWEGTGLEGKLVLTNRRLMYSKFDEKRIALTLTPADVVSIESGQKGMIIKSPVLIVKYTDRKKNKPRIVTWTVLPSVTVGGFGMVGQKKYESPHTAESFLSLLNEWKK
jgi:hypothetical protein